MLYTLFSLIVLGLLLGLKHALDSDHIVAISTIVSQTRNLKKSSLFGAFWGIGHTTALLLIGLAILILKLNIPKEIALSFEFLVGIVLILLGFNLLGKSIGMHLHKHKHGNNAHSHFHSHEGPHHHMHKSFAVGMVHGLAGSAALMLLVLATVKSILQGLLFILVFGAGSILGMLIISTLIGIPFVLTSKFSKLNNLIRILSGAISVLLGLATIYGIGFVGQL